MRKLFIAAAVCAVAVVACRKQDNQPPNPRTGEALVIPDRNQAIGEGTVLGGENLSNAGTGGAGDAGHAPRKHVARDAGTAAVDGGM